MLLSEINYNELSFDQIRKILLLSEPNREEIYGDCIMVFGGPPQINIERGKKAVELYKSGRSQKILFSGGVKWGQNEEIEAIALKKMALDNGVLERDILLETHSKNTNENVTSSSLILDREIGLHNIKRIIAISDPGHLRRCLLTLKRHMPNWIQFIMVPSDTNIPDNWWEIESYRIMALRELDAISWYVKNGYMTDEEIDLG